MDKEIKYISFYDLNDSVSDRVCSLAAVNKINYICSAVNRIGYCVNIVSPSWMGANSKKKWENQYKVRINDKTKVTFCPSFISHNKVMMGIKISIALIWLFFYLICNTKKDEKVIAYHVPWVSFPIRFAKFFKHFQLILEVEEIYNDVMTVNSVFTKWEKKLLDNADAYLFSTDLLRSKLGTKKPSVVIYGVYDIKEQLAKPSDDGIIHLIYAGIIDSNKKGAFNALEASKYLSEKYQLHIIGFGETEKLCSQIKKINTTNVCKVVYDGLLNGDEYIKYCQSCHIALSTQSMDGEYLESSYPSKILSYLSMGLRVVSCKILCVEKSSIGSLVDYYCEDLPQAIAETIKSIDLTESYDSRKVIKELDNGFMINIKKLLGGGME